MDIKFVCISDFHIGGRFNEAMYNRGMDLVNEAPDDAIVICCGDLTDSGTLFQYKLAKEMLKKLKKPFFIVPGNHDAKNVGDLLWEEFIGPRFFVNVDEERKIKLLGLDSNEPDSDTGRMGRKAIRRIYHEFQDLDNSWFKVLVFHHQTLPIPYTGRERSAINDAGDVIKAILDCNIHLVLNGHRHISNVYRLSDGDIQTLLVNVGTMCCTKTRYREEYSITEINFNQNRKNAQVNVLQLSDLGPKPIVKFAGDLTYLKVPKQKKLISTIVQIASTDFGEGKFNLEMFARGIKLINSIKCDFVVHCGNVTAESYVNEFKYAKALLQQIANPLIVLPGTQDTKPLGFELFPDYIGDMSPRIETDKLKFYGFNSCILDETEGRMGRENSRIIATELAPTPEKISIVAFHHTIIPLPRTKHEAELIDAGDVLSILINNNINLVLTGAKNKPASWQVNNTIFVNSGTLSSYNINTKDGNSFNVISIYSTSEGYYYEIEEVLLSTERARRLGTYHIRKNDSYNLNPEETRVEEVVKISKPKKPQKKKSKSN